MDSVSEAGQQPQRSREITGVVANMVRGELSSVVELCETHGVPLLAQLPYDEEFEKSIGNPELLAAGTVASALSKLLPLLETSAPSDG